MAIGRISGQMLKANLLRSGTDLAFETNLLALDVTNSRVGVGTASPATTFHVSATDAIRVPSGTTAQRPGSPANGDIRYNSTTSQIEGYSNGQFRSMVGSGISNVVEDTTPQLGGDLDINGNAIVSTSDGNIAITPNGTGEVDISKVDIDSGAIDGTAIGANSASTGAFTTLSSSGNTTIGDASGDTTTFNSASWTLANATTVSGTWANLGTVTTADINGGSIDGAVIGAASAAAGTFTNLTASGTTISITDSNGSGVIDGVNIGANSAGTGAFTTLETSGAVTVGGNLTVNGTTTTIDSATLTVEDPMIQLAKNNSGGAANSFDQGLFFNRGSLDNVSFLWDESADEFVAAVTASEDGTTAGNVTLDSYAGMRVGVLKASELNTGTIKAADGTASSTIANSTGVHTIASSVLTTTDINGGTVDGVTIGGASAGAGTFTTLASTGNTTIGDASGDTTTFNSASWTLANATTVSGTWANLGTVTTADINGGTIDGAAIGGASASTGAFTTIDASQGIDIPADSQSLRIGAGNDFTVAHDGSNTAINNATGNLTITTAASSSVVINEDSADVDFRVESNGNTHGLFVDAGNDRVGVMTSSPGYALDVSGSTDALKLPSGNTAQRPTATAGIIRYNSQTSKYEACNDGSTFVELAIAGDVPSISKVSATGDGSSTVFGSFFGSAPETVNNVLVFIDNVMQEPTENYTVSGTTITFTSAPHSGARIFALTGFDNTALASSGVARTQTSSVSFESTATTIMSFNQASYRSAELLITITDAANTEYSVQKAVVIHNGTTAFGTVYGVTNTGSTDLATIAFNHDGSNTIEVKATSTGGAQTALVQYSLQAV
tara:strand:- start:3679 stop:6210 length:2532 start_codon:yes stop_codon:yes gene_type:complete